MSNTTDNQPQSTPPAAQGLPPISLAQAVQHRHSVYALTNKGPVPDSHVVQIAKDLVRYVPSSFNSQTTRIVLLFGQDHQKFWEMAYEEHVAGAGDDEGKKSRTKGRVDMFKEGSGTALFLESNAIVQNYQQQTPAYALLFPQWSEHTSAMHQYMLWISLDALGFGANLQHYQTVPAVQERTREMFGLPKDWDLKAQLVFGGVKGEYPGMKPKLDTEETVRVFGA